MDWIVGLLLVVCGAVLGFFIARYSQNKGQQASSLHVENDIKRLMSEQAKQHLHECRQIMNSISQQNDLLQTQLEHYEALLQSEATDDPNEPQLKFFGDQAEAYLRNQAKQQKESRSGTDYQPKDFASAGTGLFTGQETSESDKK